MDRTPAPGGVSLGQRSSLLVAGSGPDLRPGVCGAGQSHGDQTSAVRPRSPWQRASVERLIGTIRRECLDHVIVFSEGSLRRTLIAYSAYYHDWRTHLALGKDAPQPRRTQGPA